jgi:Uma2 family endonuclease
MTVQLNRLDPSPNDIPPLENGDHLDQPTFHERYAAMPPGTRAELIGGVVHMPSPVRRNHGSHTLEVAGWLRDYKLHTPGVEALDNATTILGEWSEPQPDFSLLIAPECGGQTSVTVDGYVQGGPELVVEVAGSSASYDLHTKLRDYEQSGVREYVVVVLRQRQVRWFYSRDGRFIGEEAASDGVFRSEAFPGLWLDGEALLRLDSLAVRRTVELGVATPEHAAFVRRLAAARSEES